MDYHDPIRNHAMTDPISYDDIQRWLDASNTASHSRLTALDKKLQGLGADLTETRFYTEYRQLAGMARAHIMEADKADREAPRPTFLPKDEYFAQAHERLKQKGIGQIARQQIEEADRFAIMRAKQLAARASTTRPELACEPYTSLVAPHAGHPLALPAPTPSTLTKLAAHLKSKRLGRKVPVAASAAALNMDNPAGLTSPEISGIMRDYYEDPANGLVGEWCQEFDPPNIDKPDFSMRRVWDGIKNHKLATGLVAGAVVAGIGYGIYKYRQREEQRAQERAVGQEELSH